ncbi:cysteine--tRNA ligase [Roseobacter litoralis]|uniref:Cysteine--tRNA ligase n=1 Tax=Roseobacter litoralis (strain ATCC 49566 / DSM 6996 / JCM 21268 / NBRC 15278 / OCh 149) TaxID=391595 RepID=F7ZBZ2_ROSLO|nr:cysteine--tRNA ligase [Roseobacter litoralis]AEI94378.1 cysteinyl-tRNA synthetase CysS [Roseobacter litoralis Och 149]
MTIKLYNTKTRRKEDFEPINKDDVRMYVCGPTVYDRAHLGNARPVIVFDVLYRLLRHTYGPDHVTYVRNFTDVDDKINARAAESGRAIGEITAETTQWFLDDMAAVGALEPSIKDRDHQRAMPRATQYIAQMVTMIEDLIAKGHAYAAEGHVLFAVESYSKYGALSGRSIDDMIAGARVEVAPYKRNPMDFVLWKPSDDATPGWAGPVVGGKSIGRGRPGWHIECSAMAHDLLGATFDIHGGGNDLMFPHHENEIAQSTCAGHDFANVWMHNEMLQVEGKKMSKSLGNFFTVRDLLDQGVPGEVIRFVMLSTHYRKPMDWTEKKRKEAEKAVSDIHLVLLRAGYSPSMVALLKKNNRWQPASEVVNFLRDDLNTHGALQALRKLNTNGTALQIAEFAASAEFLGLVFDWDNLGLRAGLGVTFVGDHPDTDMIANILLVRQEHKQRKQFEEADRIRALLEKAGVQVNDNAGGLSSFEITNEYDPAKLEALK